MLKRDLKPRLCKSGIGKGSAGHRRHGHGHGGQPSASGAIQLSLADTANRGGCAQLAVAETPEHVLGRAVRRIQSAAQVDVGNCVLMTGKLDLKV